jgi:pentatricopeptide repeat protein
VMNSYCESDKYGCARYCLFRIVGADHVPDHLWPSDETETKEVIEDKFRMNH